MTSLWIRPLYVSQHIPPVFPEICPEDHSWLSHHIPMTLTHEFLLVKPEKNILNMANHLSIYIYTHVLVKSHVWDFQQTDSHQHVAGRLTHIYICVYV